MKILENQSNLSKVSDKKLADTGPKATVLWL